MLDLPCGDFVGIKELYLLIENENVRVVVFVLAHVYFI
jgi:hypothetical protein